MQLIQQQQQHQINQQQQQLQRSTGQQQPGGQLQGSQLQSGQALNFPSASIVGAQVLPNEIRGRDTFSSLSNGNSSLGNNIIGAPSSGQLNCMPMPAYGLGATESNVPKRIGRMSTYSRTIPYFYVEPFLVYICINHNTSGVACVKLLYLFAMIHNKIQIRYHFLGFNCVK